MDNLDILVKALNKIENYGAKYIYKKYIEIDVDINDLPNAQEITDTSGALDTPELTILDSSIIDTSLSVLNENINFKYSNKPISKEEYKLYTDKIFSKERKTIIKQRNL